MMSSHDDPPTAKEQPPYSPSESEMAQAKPTSPDRSAKISAEDAAAIILDQERRRKRRTRRKRREAEQQHHAAMDRMRQSIEVIKWCALLISGFMFISLVIGLVVLNQVQNEVARIQTEVVNIQREAEMIRDKIRHPLESLGSSLGRSLDSTVREQLGVEE